MPIAKGLKLSILGEDVRVMRVIDEDNLQLGVFKIKKRSFKVGHSIIIDNRLWYVYRVFNHGLQALVKRS